MEFVARVGFHGDHDDVVVKVEAADIAAATDRTFDWFDQDHEGPAVYDVEILDPAGVPAEVLANVQVVGQV